MKRLRLRPERAKIAHLRLEIDLGRKPEPAEVERPKIERLLPPKPTTDESGDLYSAAELEALTKPRKIERLRPQPPDDEPGPDDDLLVDEVELLDDDDGGDDEPPDNGGDDYDDEPKPFKVIKFQKKTLALIEQANAIIAEYDGQGFRLILRQLYYQFVARGWLENTLQNYKKLGRHVGNARDTGLIAWDAMEDRSRELHTHSSWENPGERIRDVAYYREDPWREQPWLVEVWIEKDSLIGIIENVCGEYRVPYYATKGNNSQLLQYEAGQRFRGVLDQGKKPLVLFLSDHDPTGIDMERDNRERLSLYARRPIEVRRIALTREQVRQYAPPPNYAKDDDARFDAYVATFGSDECWELDALSPTVIDALIRTELIALIDDDKWQASLANEARGRTLLGRVADEWRKVEQLFTGSSDDEPDPDDVTDDDA